MGEAAQPEDGLEQRQLIRGTEAGLGEVLLGIQWQQPNKD
jgi:hypothetical protein